jgi:2-methylcitrate dehydratase PrpD
LPALFALAESYPCSGQAFLAAYIVGLEVFYRIALASEGQMGGWHRSALFGALATAAASAKLLNLSRSQIQTAIGISTSLTGGVQLNFGTMSKAVQVGNAGRSGLVAALLAKAGCSGNPNSLDEPNGFGSTFYSGQFNTAKIVDDFGTPFNIIFPGMAVKIHPCCGLTHAPADIVLDLVRTHNILPDQVSDVVVYGEELWPTVLIYQQPTTGYQGKYSMQYVVAAAITDREIGPNTFTDEQVNRPELQAYFERIRLLARPDSEWESVRQHPWNHCAEVVIRLRDGTQLSANAPCARGYPDLPLSTDEIVQKFRDCSKPSLSSETIDLIIDRAFGLDDNPDLSDFMKLARRPSQ